MRSTNDLKDLRERAENHPAGMSLAIAASDLLALLDTIQVMQKALDWYADGLYPGDESETEVGVMRTGRRAREAVVRADQLLAGDAEQNGDQE